MNRIERFSSRIHVLLGFERSEFRIVLSRKSRFIVELKNEYAIARYHSKEFVIDY